MPSEKTKGPWTKQCTVCFILYTFYVTLLQSGPASVQRKFYTVYFTL